MTRADMVYAAGSVIAFGCHCHLVERALHVAAPAYEHSELAVAAQRRIAGDQEVAQIRDFAGVALIRIAGIEEMPELARRLGDEHGEEIVAVSQPGGDSIAANVKRTSL